MKELKIKNSTKTALVDDEDYDRLLDFVWYFNGHSIVRIYHEENKTINVPLANEIMQKFGVIFDHKNRLSCDNKKENLREATVSQNNANRERIMTSISIYRGVHRNKGVRYKKWRAVIKHNKKYIYLGYFRTQKEAAEAYDTAAKQYHGEFAVLNFP